MPEIALWRNVLIFMRMVFSYMGYFRIYEYITFIASSNGTNGADM